ncbi:MAG: tyrosine-type recombinase/integrase [Acetivibrio ethanolgignens]
MAKRGQGEGTISKRPDGTWWGRISLGYDENGKRKRKAFYGKTRKEVQEKLTAALAEINNDTYIEPSKMTVGQWMDIWLKEYKFNSIKPSTYDLYNQRVEAYIVPKLGGCKLQDLRNDIVQRFINSLVEKGLSSSVVTGTYMILHGALDQAVENGLLAKNPASKIKLPKVEHKKTRVFTPEEQEAFVKAAWKYRNGDMFVLMLATGLRVGEAIALTWDDIDLENRLLKLRLN